MHPPPLPPTKFPTVAVRESFRRQSLRRSVPAVPAPEIGIRGPGRAKRISSSKTPAAIYGLSPPTRRPIKVNAENRRKGVSRTGQEKPHALYCRPRTSGYFVGKCAPAAGPKRLVVLQTHAHINIFTYLCLVFSYRHYFLLLLLFIHWVWH
jgi:hypothetical protein